MPRDRVLAHMVCPVNGTTREARRVTSGAKKLESIGHPPASQMNAQLGWLAQILLHKICNKEEDGRHACT